MEKKVLAFMKRHQLLEKNTTVLVAVSGGPDSMALLHLLLEMREAWHLRLIALTIDHQLRDEARADVNYVRDYCEQKGIQHDAVKIDVNQYMKEHKLGTQVAARQLRYHVFANKMKEYGAQYIAMGHHGDDQTETMVMSLIRTTSLHNLQGIPYQRPFAGGKIIRPFLAVTKAEIETYCTKHHLSPRIDPTNFEAIYTRNKIRQAVLPTIKEINEQAHETIQALSERLQEDESYLIDQAKTMKKDLLIYDKEQKRWTIDICQYKQYALPLQRRCFRLTLDYLYDKIPDNLSYQHENLFMQLQKITTSNQILHFPKGLHIEKSYDKIHFYFQARKVDSFHIKIDQVPSKVILPNGQTLTIDYVEEAEDEAEHTFSLPLSAVKFPLYIRSRKNGDRMTYDGLQGTKKLKDIFIDEKVPRLEREQYCLLTDASDEIFWLIGLRKNKINSSKLDEVYIQFTYDE